MASHTVPYSRNRNLGWDSKASSHHSLSVGMKNLTAQSKKSKGQLLGAPPDTRRQGQPWQGKNNSTCTLNSPDHQSRGTQLHTHLPHSHTRTQPPNNTTISTIIHVHNHTHQNTASHTVHTTPETQNHPKHTQRQYASPVLGCSRNMTLSSRLWR
jgi:hypothetical protein